MVIGIFYYLTFVESKMNLLQHFALDRPVRETGTIIVLSDGTFCCSVQSALTESNN